MGFTNVVFTREPGGSAIAEQIRNIILDAKNKEMDDMCEAFLYASARIQHLHDIVRPALSEGKVVFCDRFVHSSYTYQGLGRGLGYDRIVALNKLAVGDCMPQFTVFLDLSPEKAFERKGGADKTDRLEMVNIDFHKRVYQGYLDVIAENPSAFEVIDASGTPVDFGAADNGYFGCQAFSATEALFTFPALDSYPAEMYLAPDGNVEQGVKVR